MFKKILSYLELNKITSFKIIQRCINEREFGYNPMQKQLNSAERSHESRSKLKLRTKYRIMFLSCNLLTGSESVVWFA
ncbi:hypothetical protein BW243_07160 [Leptospira interrogans serovar Pomona]|nr:hypothetical protein BW243_07160 [Leptospira interrogans serovar Pomona]